jgi:hypothetical protein
MWLGDFPGAALHELALVPAGHDELDAAAGRHRSQQGKERGDA